MGFLIAVAALMAGFGTAYVASDDVRYLTRAGAEETRILQSRRPIADVVEDPATDAATRASLTLVLDVRDAAARYGLAAKETYTTFAPVGRDTLLLVLQAAPKNCICAYTWKYPIVGEMPYKGFFDPKMALAAQRKLSAKGYDTYLRPSAAFSTLGWFNDPLLSTALTRDSVELAATVFHEIAHNTLYVKSATPFNESFAQLVGYRSAEAYFRARGDSALALQAANRWHDEIVLAGFYHELVAKLDSFYAMKPAPAALDSGRAAMGRWAREQLEGPVGAELRTYRIARMADRPINNARLVGALIYRTHLDWFDRWYAEHGSDVSASVAALEALERGASGDTAFARLGHALGVDSAGVGPAPAAGGE